MGRIFAVEADDAVGVLVIFGLEGCGVGDITHIHSLDTDGIIALLEGFGIKAVAAVGAVGHRATLLGVVGGAILLGSILEGNVARADLRGYAVELHAGAQKVLGRHFRDDEYMAGIDGIATTLNELDDVETELGLDDGRHLAGFQGKSCRLKLSNHPATGEETQFAAFAGGAGVLRIQRGKHRETFALDNTLAKLSKLSTDTVTFGFRNGRLNHDFGNLITFGHHREAVGGERIEEFCHLCRCHLDILGDAVFDAAAEEVGTDHTVVLFLQLIVGKACRLADGLLGAIAFKVALKETFKVLIHLLVTHFNTVHLAFVHKKLR